MAENRDPRVGMFQLSIDEAAWLLLAMERASYRNHSVVPVNLPLYERLKAWHEHRIAVSD